LRADEFAELGRMLSRDREGVFAAVSLFGE